MGRILFIVEGDRYEPKVLEHLWKNLVPEYADAKVIYTYRTHIYNLYKELHKDADLSLTGVLKERNPGILPEDSDEDTFQEIYLIFDYDGHVNMPVDKETGLHIEGDSIIEEMLRFFDDENDKGRLFINYPMVESIKHLTSDPVVPQDLVTAKCKGPRCPNTECAERASCPPVKEYKSIVNSLVPKRANMTKIAWSEWRDIFSHHLEAGRIISSMPHGTGKNIEFPYLIFRSQLIHFISRSCPQVAVLSAFPLFFHYYLGDNLIPRLNSL